MEDFDKLEYEQAYSFFKATVQEFFRILTVLVIVNATVIGFAIDQYYGILVLGTIIQIIILLANKRAGIILMPLMYQIIKIEKKYHQGMPLMKLLAIKLKEEESIKNIENVIEMNDEKATEKLFKARKHVPSLLSKNAKSIIIVIAAIQTIIPLVIKIVETIGNNCGFA